jgi:septal ring factor EnvC (AmiA/AmiB activator)
MPSYFNRAELERQIKELQDEVTFQQSRANRLESNLKFERREVRQLTEAIEKSQDREAELSRKVLKQNRIIQEYEREIARLDERLTPYLVKEALEEIA